MAFTKITGPGIHTLSNIMTHNVKSSGIITAVNGNLSGWLAVGQTASFGGDVSIGGTLTYDDVTNVESVGIITAKAGIHVGAGGTILYALSEDDGAIGLNNTTPSTQYYNNLVVGSNNAGSWGITVRTNSANSGNLAFSDTDSANAGRYDGRISYEHTDQSMRFHTNAEAGGTTERLRITGIGSVGINETSPEELLDLGENNQQNLKVGQRGYLGQAYSTAATILGHSVKAKTTGTTASGMIVTETNSGGGAPSAIRQVSGTIQFHTKTSGTADAAFDSERFRIYGNGAVLIGADSGEAGGEAKLAIDCEGMDIFDDVGDPTNYGLIFANDPTTNKANGIGFFNDSASTCGGYIVHQDRGSGNIGDLLFGTSSTSDTPVERLRIASNGHVGINYGVNPNRYLQVRTIDGAAHNGVFAGENVNASNAATMFFLSTYRDSSSTEKFMQFNRDQDNSNQGVLAVFDVLTNGNVRNSNNSYSSISDVKLKENIIDASSQWNDIKNLRVRKFNFKSTPSETLIGVVAQEIETVSPGLVDDIPDMDLTKEGHEGTSTKSVKYSVLYMKAIKCLQEAQARIETLEAKVAALEGS